MRQLLLLSACFLTFAQQTHCFLENDGWVSMELQHALDLNDPEHFTYRGNISIPSLNSGLSSIVQELLTPQQRSALNALAARNEYYRLRVIVSYPTGRKSTFLTATRTCNFALSELNDILWMSIDNLGFVNSITLTTAHTQYTSCPSDTDILSDDFDEINTDLLIRHTDLAPTPDTASFIQRMEREREARERGEGRDNRGFFAKYWMYILPVVLLLFISGATNQDAAK